MRCIMHSHVDPCARYNDLSLRLGQMQSVVIHPCPSTSRIETRTAMHIAAHGLCVCRCILYYSFYSTTAYRCHPFHPLYYSDIMQPIIDSGKVKLTLGALIRHLDSKYLKTDTSTIVVIYGEYFLLTLNKGDNVEKHIELLNAATNRIAQAGYKDFMHKVICGIHLLMCCYTSLPIYVTH